MRIFRTPFLAAAIAAPLAVAALPAAAGGIPFDLPRLDFPAPGADTSRDCTLLLVPQAPDACAPAGN